jgi:hypothetical protein
MMTKFAAITCILGAAAMAGDLGPAPVTLYKDVLPILQRKCMACHQPGQIAPVSFTPREVEILARWADGGAPEGHPGEAPPPTRWPENNWWIQPTAK